MMKAMRYSLLLITFCARIQLISTGMCARLKSLYAGGKTIFYTEYYCCSFNEIEKDGDCQECPVGYTVFNTTYCSQCPANTYGKRCAELCNCKEDARCDHIFGCINFISMIDASTITADYATTNREVYSTSDKLDYEPSWVSEETTKSSNTGFNFLHIIVYILIAFGIVSGIVLIVGYVVFRRKEMRTTNPNMATNEEHEIYIAGHEYEEINEMHMLDSFGVNVQVDHDNSSEDCSSNPETVDKYLNPNDKYVITHDHDQENFTSHTDRVSGFSDKYYNHGERHDYQQLYQTLQNEQDQSSGYATCKVEPLEQPLIDAMSDELAMDNSLADETNNCPPNAVVENDKRLSRVNVFSYC